MKMDFKTTPLCLIFAPAKTIMLLHNRVNKDELKKLLMEEPIKRITLSFYRYVIIESPAEYRDELYKRWDVLNVKGRIYVAHEGINAQLSVPEEHFEVFKNGIESDKLLSGVPLKIAVEDDGK